jgi:hypothetical protein
MKFSLEFHLDNAEAAEDPEIAAKVYLDKVAARVYEGYRTGPIKDGNGGTIGYFKFDE